MEVVNGRVRSVTGGVVSVCGGGRRTVSLRLGIGAVLGYLLAGIAIGPWGLGFISDVDEILHFSELGVVFLMFIIGTGTESGKTVGVAAVDLWRGRGSGIAECGAPRRFIDADAVFRQAAVIGGIGFWRCHLPQWRCN